MRYSFAVFAAVAAAQYSNVQPISQISDGQIQAPPATLPAPAPSSAPVAGASSVVVPVAPVPSVAKPSVSAGPSVPAGTYSQFTSWYQFI
jgi:hypothetical protein